MSDEMKWIWMGSGQWSKIFDGKDSVINELWHAVQQTLVPPFKVRAKCIIADKDNVVVEAIGENRTPDGKSYENKYCWVFHIKNEKIYELREYMDTELVTRTFGNKGLKVIGEEIMVDFKMAKAILQFQTETSLKFTIIEKEGKNVNETETVDVILKEIRPNLFLLTWTELNGSTVTQIQDYEKGMVYSNWTLPGGEFKNMEGSLKLLTKF